MSRWSKMTVPLSNETVKEPVPIVSDASMASRGIADGRMIPLLIIETSKRLDIEDMIRAHKDFGPGDAETGWSPLSRFDKSKIRLIIYIKKPSQCVIVLEFDVARQGGVVDQIIQAQGVYIQAGRMGDRLKSTIDNERILIEVPSRKFQKMWDQILYKALKKDFRRKGLDRHEAIQATEDFLKEWRHFGSLRMPSD
jgi:mRNA-degrading endonuclease RelE of RelBE toxin-antitoxin system